MMMGAPLIHLKKGKYEILEFESEHNKRRLAIEFESETGTNLPDLKNDGISRS